MNQNKGITAELSSALGERNEEPNKRLAKRIFRTQDREAVQELIAIIRSASEIGLIADALKTLEMVGQEDPKLASPAFEVCWPLIHHKQNKIVWRAICVVTEIAVFHHQKLYKHLPQLLDVMDKGSVITRDHGFRILVELYGQAAYQENLHLLLVEQVYRAPPNQLGQYAEKWLAVITPRHRPDLIKTLEDLQPSLTSPSHQRRISKILRQLNRMNQGQKN